MLSRIAVSKTRPSICHARTTTDVRATRERVVVVVVVAVAVVVVVLIIVIIGIVVIIVVIAIMIRITSEDIPLHVSQ